MITKVISGCQTGADQGGLDAAIDLGIPTGGWVPRGRRNENGKISTKYTTLRETQSSGYPDRTRRNVMAGDGTIILVYGQPKRGSKLTKDLAVRNGRPHLVVNLKNGVDPQVVVDWILQNNIQVLNVAGSRESSSAGIRKRVKALLLEVLPQVT